MDTNVTNFNATERKVLDWIIGDQADGEAIRAQLATARQVSRRNTGADFYTTFQVVPDPIHRLARTQLVGDAWARVPGLIRGMTFLLWANQDGFLFALEGAGFGEDISSVDFDTVQIERRRAPAGCLTS